MIVLVLIQGFLPLQAHTTIIRDGTGQVAVVCTWDGTRRVDIQLPDENAPGAERHRQLLPAMLFSDLLSGADVPAPLAAVRILSQLSQVQTLYRERASAAITPGRYHIRAPPNHLPSSDGTQAHQHMLS